MGTLIERLFKKINYQKIFHPKKDLDKIYMVLRGLYLILKAESFFNIHTLLLVKSKMRQIHSNISLDSKPVQIKMPLILF